MKKHIILTGTTIVVVALCWAICGGTPAVDTVPAPAAESAVSAPCAPQTQPIEPSCNIIIAEPVTQPETVPVAGSAGSPAQDCPRATRVVVPEPTPAEEPTTELPATIPEPASIEESITKTSQPQDGMVYVPGFGYLQSEGPGEWSFSEDMYENGNKVGIMR